MGCVTLNRSIIHSKTIVNYFFISTFNNLKDNSLPLCKLRIKGSDIIVFMYIKYM